VILVLILAVLGVLFAIFSAKRRAQAMEFLTGRRGEADRDRPADIL
jgi:uncharacterized membrane protein